MEKPGVVSRLASLPRDVIGVILTKVGAASAPDFHNAILSCKKIHASSNTSVVYRSISLAPLVKKPLAASEDHAEVSCPQQPRCKLHTRFAGLLPRQRSPRWPQSSRDSSRCRAQRSNVHLRGPPPMQWNDWGGGALFRPPAMEQFLHRRWRRLEECEGILAWIASDCESTVPQKHPENETNRQLSLQRRGQHMCQVLLLQENEEIHIHDVGWAGSWEANRVTLSFFQFQRGVWNKLLDRHSVLCFHFPIPHATFFPQIKISLLL